MVTEVTCNHCSKTVMPKHRFGTGVFILLILILWPVAVWYWFARHGKYKCPSCNLPLGGA